MRGQNKKYLSLYLYKGKIWHLHAQKNKKRPTHPRTTKRGVQSASRLVRIVHVCISLWIAPFVFRFYPTASWVLYLNTAFFICPVRMKKLFFFVYCGAEFNPRKVNATGIPDGAIIDFYNKMWYTDFAWRHNILNLRHCFCTFIFVYASEHL